MSRSFGRLADIPLPSSARRPVLGSFARAVGIDLSEAELPLDDYPSLNAFFVRRLRSGARRWPDDPDTIVSPVDGIVGQLGRIHQGVAIQAKGHRYPVSELLATEGEDAPFRDGHFLTIYLSPRHYHRIHTPCRGTIRRATYAPGALYPVNAPSVMHIPRLFVRNERLICFLEGAVGRIAVVAVGAYNVGRISAAFDSTWSGKGRAGSVTNQSLPPHLHRIYSPPISVPAADEIMAFHLGSTVVLLFEPRVKLRPDLRPGLEVKLGEVLEEDATPSGQTSTVQR